MIVLTENKKILNEYNEQTIQFAKEHPNLADFCRTYSSLFERFIPYADWVKNLSDEEKKKYKIIPDTASDFSGFYIAEDEANDHYIVPLLTDYEVDDYYENREYGVCDNASQIIDNFKFDDNSIVLMTPLYKEEQPKSCGWRWCKWGEYYGVQNHQHTYLADEEDIEMIFIFTIMKLKPKENAI